LIIYIHRNPSKHGFIDDFRMWPYSSYGATLSAGATFLVREKVFALFGGSEAFIEYHKREEPRVVFNPSALEGELDQT
jgi:hypothetical protein